MGSAVDFADTRSPRGALELSDGEEDIKEQLKLKADVELFASRARNTSAIFKLVWGISGGSHDSTRCKTTSLLDVV